MFFKKKSNQSIRGCSSCGLSRKCLSPMMKASGEGAKGILLIGEAPGEQEDEQGIQFVGKSGQYLQDILFKCGIDMEEDCYKINSVNCRPMNKKGENRKPTTKEINCCRHMWKQAVKELKPEKIILLGLTAVTSFLGDRMTDLGTMERWLNWKIPDQDYKIWIYPTYHPSYVIRNLKNKALSNYFENSINQAITHKQPFKQHKQNIKLLIKDEDIIAYLNQLIKNPPEELSIDYEGSGLKPHKEGHFARTVSFSSDAYSAVAFPILKSKLFLNLFKQVLTGPSKKIAQHMSFERTWTQEIFGYDLEKLSFDTMIASHVLDNRSGITSLKFQSYIRYGVTDYSKTVGSYLKSKIKGGNEFNNIHKAPLKPLLFYNGSDSMFTFRLKVDQTKELKERGLDDAYDFFHDGVVACHNTSRYGMRIDTAYFENQHKILTKKLNELDKQIKNSNEHNKWIKYKGIDLDILSSDQIKKLILDVLKLKTGKKTKKDNTSVDKEVLAKLAKKNEFFNLILEYRKNHKIKGTYVEGILRESINGIVHPNINLHLARTYRSSVDAPNFQNIPKRDEEAKKLVRTGIIPRKGNKLMAVDYSGAEIRSGCVYHGDRQMIAYQVEGKGDMHKEYAGKLYLIPIEEVDSDTKYEGKNGFIFPQFYGDYYGNNVKQLWPASLRLKRKDGTTLREHLKEQGINTLYKYENHVREIEREFWEETFWEFNEWKQEAWDEYVDKGHIEMLTGFQCGGVMDRKNVVNYPFQGTAFHWLLWSMIEVEHILRTEGWKSRIIMQVHDELLIDYYPPEEKKLLKLVKRIMTKDIIEYWPWINIPLEVEAKVSAVDGNWYEMEVIK